ncbi:MAG: amidase [Deltaproteobacteria bacterium]|nr:amidase [Deltaproteobacteria bacterium]
MAALEDVLWLDATAQAELIRRKEIRSLELVEAAIAAIERLNPRINAVVTPLYEQGRAAAAGDLPEGPFTGVPFLLKDILASYAGATMTLGAALLRHFVPDRDSELVNRYKMAGLVIIGKTNVPEFGILPTTEPLLFGPCRNPWNPERTAGGSSGGSAAAVASGLVPLAHGNDGGGSIRIPASCCGVFGLKPTRARNPLGPNFGDLMSGLIAEHALTRSVRDSAALLDATCGPDLGDPYWAPPPARPYIHEVGANTGRLRIAFSARAAAGVEVHDDCLEALRDAAALCAELGHEVQEDQPRIDLELLNTAFTVVWSAGLASTLEGISRLLSRPLKPADLEPLTWMLYEIGRKQSGADYLLAVQALQDLSRKAARFHHDYDVWLTPTLAQPPLPLGSFESLPDDPLNGLRRSAAFAAFTPIANITGQPAMSVPLFWNATGLPVGTHFIGRFGDEAALFRLAAQLEAARPWAGRRPPIALQ